MNRRDFIRKLTGIASVTTAGVLIPKISYFFIHDNPITLWGVPLHTDLTVNESQILAIQLEHFIKHIPRLFNNDDKFFRALKSHEIEIVSNHNLHVPLNITR